MEHLDAFMPHGMCYLWRPDLLALHVGSDLLIALAYFSIPAALLSFLRQRPDIEFSLVFKLFIAFILSCGVSHAFSIVVVWEPLYVIEGVLKLITAVISGVTAIMLWPLIPKAVALPSPATLRERNAEIESLNRELEARIESLSTLAGGVAHDFNNMLTVITGHADLMASGEREPSRAEHLQSITAAASRAGSLCQQMLAYSGRGHFVMEPGQLNDCIDGPALEATADADITVELADELAPIRCATAQLRELVAELVRNAVEASRPGQAQVAVRTLHRDLDAEQLAAARFPHELTPGPAVVLEVSDHGHGMDDETLRRLFDPCFSTRFIGRGLGLSAVQGICRGHGAALWIDSSPQAGTTVRIAFAAAMTVDDGYRERESRRVRKVLVLDDEPGLLELAAAYCAELGIQAETTDDADQAIERLLEQGNDIDAVILDFVMPLRTGDEVLREIREFSAVDVYLTSGFSRGEFDDPELRSELTGFLPKPFRLEDFRRALCADDADSAEDGTAN